MAIRVSSNSLEILPVSDCKFLGQRMALTICLGRRVLISLGTLDITEMQVEQQKKRIGSPKSRRSPRQDLGLIINGNAYVPMTSKILLVHSFQLFVEHYWDCILIIFHVPLTLLLLAQHCVLYNSETPGRAFPVFYRNFFVHKHFAVSVFLLNGVIWLWRIKSRISNLESWPCTKLQISVVKVLIWC